jgi:hypothetical protein
VLVAGFSPDRLQSKLGRISVLGSGFALGCRYALPRFVGVRRGVGSDSAPSRMICGSTWPLLFEPGGVERMPPIAAGPTLKKSETRVWPYSR